MNLQILVHFLQALAKVVGALLDVNALKRIPYSWGKKPKPKQQTNKKLTTKNPK